MITVNFVHTEEVRCFSEGKEKRFEKKGSAFLLFRGFFKITTAFCRRYYTISAMGALV